jgi:hypothetical protein
LTLTLAKTMARKGKIAGLPREIREELNERLADGQQGPVILPWLNALPAVRERLAVRARADSGEVAEITDGNLSEWRAGGYQEWCQDARVRNMAHFVSRLADASGQPPESLLRKVWTGKMLEIVEAMETEEALSDQDGGDAGRVSKTFLMAGGTIATISAAAQREKEHADKTRQTDLKLGLEKIKVARTFVKFVDDAKALALAEAAKTDDRRLPELADYLLGAPDLERLENQ